MSVLQVLTDAGIWHGMVLPDFTHHGEGSSGRFLLLDTMIVFD
jgi:hypothetical protein